MRFTNFQPIAGSSYVKFPQKIISKHAVINMENKDDNKCFMHAIT